MSQSTELAWTQVCPTRLLARAHGLRRGRRIAGQVWELGGQEGLGGLDPI